MNLTFDEFSFPSGLAGDLFWRTLVTRLFTDLNAIGWDLPNSLLAVYDPVTSAQQASSPGRDTGPVPIVLDLTSLDDPGVEPVMTQYRIEPLASGHVSPREMLPGVRVPPGVAALIQVDEAWTRLVTPDEQPAVEGREPGWFPATDADAENETWRRGRVRGRVRDAADRMETRQAFLMLPDGAIRSYSHVRGTPEDDPEFVTVFIPDENQHIRGVVVDLIRRVWGLPVEPDSSLGEFLGRVALTVLAAQTDRILAPEHAPVALLSVVAGMLDGLDSPYPADSDAPEMRDIMVARGPLNDQLRDMLAAQAFGPLLGAGRLTARKGWTAFLTRPGTRRWIRRDENKTVLTDDLWAWYGPGVLSRVLDERIPDWAHAYNAVVAAYGVDVARVAVGFLRDMGWEYDPTRTI